MGKPVLLKTQADFDAFRTSKSYQGPTIRIRVRHGANQNIRFGFIIPKKLVPKAVARNLLKRRIKAAFLKLAPKLKPADILFFPRSQALTKKFSDLESEIKSVCTNARLWKF